MAVTTIYSCDRCGAEQGSGSQMWTVAVHLAQGTTVFTPQHQALWCRKCCELFGVFKPSITKPLVVAEHIPPVPQPPLEVFLREFVQQVIDENQS